MIAGFGELEYWASPTFFGGAADSDYHVLLLNKLVLSVIALVLLYLFWAFRNLPAQSSHSEGSGE